MKIKKRKNFPYKQKKLIPSKYFARIVSKGLKKSRLFFLWNTELGVFEKYALFGW